LRSFYSPFAKIKHDFGIRGIFFSLLAILGNIKLIVTLKDLISSPNIDTLRKLAARRFIRNSQNLGKKKKAIAWR
jgi:hypothetical protein